MYRLELLVCSADRCLRTSWIPLSSFSGFKIVQFSLSSVLTSDFRNVLFLSSVLILCIQPALTLDFEKNILKFIHKAQKFLTGIKSYLKAPKTFLVGILEKEITKCFYEITSNGKYSKQDFSKNLAVYSRGCVRLCLNVHTKTSETLKTRNSSLLISS